MADPFGPGVTARYEDGLRVTVSEPRREPAGRAHRFTVTYENGTDETIEPGDDSGYGGGPLAVNAGEPLGDGAPDDGSSSDWLNDGQVAQKLLPPLHPGDSVTVPLRVTGSTEDVTISVEVAPQDDEFRDTAYWHLTLG